MYTVLLVIHLIVCFFLIGVVLLQQGKGADMGAVFGGSSQTLFGSGGAGNFLTRMTGVAATIFLITSLGLAYTSARRIHTTIMDDAPLSEPAVPPAEPQAAAPEAGAAPAAPAAAPAAEAPAAAPAAQAPANAPAAQAPAPADQAPAAAAPAEAPK